MTELTRENVEALRDAADAAFCDGARHATQTEGGAAAPPGRTAAPAAGAIVTAAPPSPTLDRYQIASLLFEAAFAIHPRASGIDAKPSGREFALYREVDVTGLSGTGVVAEGIQLASGLVVLQWRPPHTSVVVWPSIDEMLAVHGHDGKTVVRWRA